MNPNEDEELNRILARVDFTETDDEPSLSPELIGAVQGRIQDYGKGGSQHQVLHTRDPAVTCTYIITGS